jgi:phage repressor protein C with HTH and peptisase S24 domain
MRSILETSNGTRHERQATTRVNASKSSPDQPTLAEEGAKKEPREEWAIAGRATQLADRYRAPHDGRGNEANENNEPSASDTHSDGVNV